ncbi:dihydroorotase [Spirochaeta dissipatitropha]
MNAPHMTFRRPDDMHLHIRQDDFMRAVLPETARVFSRAIIMPNTIPAIIKAEDVTAYREQIRAASEGLDFEPLMTFKIIPGLKSDDLNALKSVGVTAGKLYPEGATTNTEDGVTDVREIYPVLEIMQELGIVLCIHGEDPAVSSLEREEAFLPVLRNLSRDFPGLKIVMEHLSTRAAVDAVAQLPNVAGTLTLHHLLINIDDMLGGQFNPHYFCKPIVKHPDDQAAVRRAALSGDPSYFFGTDSAPHPAAAKHSPVIPAGVFTAPVAFPALLEFFEDNNSLHLVEDFSSRFGAEFYGLPLNSEQVIVQREDWQVPGEIAGVVPFFAGRNMRFHITRSS